MKDRLHIPLEIQAKVRIADISLPLRFCRDTEGHRASPIIEGIVLREGNHLRIFLDHPLYPSLDIERVPPRRQIQRKFVSMLNPTEHAVAAAEASR